MAIQFDFDSIKTRIENSLRNKEEWKNLLFFSTNSRLIEAEAEEINQLALYREFLQRELFWGKANNLSSLIEQAKILGYYPYRQNGAIGVLRVGIKDTFDESHPVDINIPANTVFKNSDGVKFSTLQGYILPNTANFIDITVLQGIPVSFNFIAQGTSLESFDILNANLENNNSRVTVNNMEYTIVNNIYEYSSSDLVVEIRNKNDFSGITLRFGDGVNGKKLDINDTIIFEGYETLGLDGNITNIGSVTTVESVVYDNNNEKVKLYVTNNEEILGGSNYETKEELRANAPKAFQTGGRISTKSDYEYIINSSPIVLKSSVWGEFEINQDLGRTLWDFIPVEENVVSVVAINNVLTGLTESQKEGIYYDILDLKSPTDLIKFYDPEIIYLKFNSFVFTSNRGIKLLDLTALVNNTIKNSYNLSVLDFFENIYFSDYQALIDNVENVRYHTTDVSLIRLVTFNDAYFAGLNLNLFPIKEGSVMLYVRNKEIDDDFVLIGVDNSVGGFSAEAGYNLTGSSVGYNDGSIAINVVSGLSDPYDELEIKIVFKLTDNNLILKKRFQIYQYSEEDSNIKSFYTN